MKQQYTVHDLKELKEVFVSLYAQFPMGEEHTITVEPPEKKRSVLISTRFHGHCYYIWKKLIERGLHITREQVKYKVLDTALEVEVHGGDPWPCHPSRVKLREPIAGMEYVEIMVPDITTSDKTNKQMMTACEACQILAYELEIGELPEKYDKWRQPYANKSNYSESETESMDGVQSVYQAS